MDPTEWNRVLNMLTEYYSAASRIQQQQLSQQPTTAAPTSFPSFISSPFPNPYALPSAQTCAPVPPVAAPATASAPAAVAPAAAEIPAEIPGAGRNDAEADNIEPARNVGFIRGILRIQLLIKLAVFVSLFAQDGNRMRLWALIVFAVLVYLYQVLWNDPVRADRDHARDEGADDGDEEMWEQLRAAEAAEAADARRNADVAQQQPAGFVKNVERFVVGLFASLIPSWQPVPVPRHP
jgi:hypothetical protein